MDPRAVKRATVAALILFACFITALTIGSALLAQAGGEYDLSWSAIVGGGDTLASGGSYQLGGAAGQPGAGIVQGGAYHLEGGFWHCFPLVSPECTIASKSMTYLPVVLNPN